MRGGADEVYGLARALRLRHGPEDEGVTFTHVPGVVDPQAALALVRASALGPLLPEEGELLNAPTTEWYEPVEPVPARVDALEEVRVTASTWEPPRWDPRAAELVVRFVYAEGGRRRANLDLRLHAREGQPLTLSRHHHDHQIAQMGYDGEERLSREPTEVEVTEMLNLVRRLTGETAPPLVA